MISNRHIRHDWQTFVNWEQKSVKTMCDQKSQPRLSGIPGITDAPLDSWCPKCVYWTIRGWGGKQAPLVNVLANLRASSTDTRIQSLYDNFFKIVIQASKLNSQ